MKDFKTVDEQIELLKLRGLSFLDEAQAKKLLLNNNYYNIINGYKTPFINDYDNDIFKTNSTFEEIYSLYEFDRQLRSIFLEYILKIENSLRALIAYHFSEIYGHDNYLKLDNFETFKGNDNVSIKTKENQIKHIQNLIGTVNKKIGKSIDNTPYIKHYMTQYGYVPMWVLVNIMSFGDICNFLKLMKQRQRIQISIHFNIMEYDLTNLLGILCHTRNLCAHDERLYNYVFPSSETINDNRFHAQLNINKINDRYVVGKNDLFSVVIALKLLLPDEDYKRFHHKMFSRIMSIKSKVKTIPLENILELMHFPNNWHDILKMS